MHIARPGDEFPSSQLINPPASYFISTGRAQLVGEARPRAARTQKEDSL